ncbi:MAG: methyltransferase domain-containing protein [Spirochaetales bacterium]|nr:methyltransferase domain-containing protein [Spirochaetales bacterium]
MRWAERFFDAFMYPLEAVAFSRRRRARMRSVSGRVLEIGAGTGVNLSHYSFSKIDQLHLSDLTLTNSVQARVPTGVLTGVLTPGTEIFYHEVDVQSLPFDDAVFDHVVSTLVFCSVPDPARGLAEIRRVLKPDGSLVFIEHVKPDIGILRQVVDVLNPVWRSFNGECNLNRDTLSEMRRAGFTIQDVHRGGRGLVVDGIARPAE